MAVLTAKHPLGPWSNVTSTLDPGCPMVNRWAGISYRKPYLQIRDTAAREPCLFKVPLRFQIISVPNTIYAAGQTEDLLRDGARASVQPRDAGAAELRDRGASGRRKHGVCVHRRAGMFTQAQNETAAGYSPIFAQWW